MNKIVIATVLAAVVLAPCLPVFAQNDELMKVRMTAQAHGEGVAARATAVERAEQEILRQTLAAVLPLDDLTPLEALIRKPAAFIRSTQLVRFETADGSTLVEVECFVKRNELLKSAARLLLARMTRPPVVLVLMAEQFGSAGVLDASRAGAAETALSKELREAGLEVADSAAVRDGADPEDLLARISASSGSPAELAARAGAQTVILGEAVVIEGEPPAAGNIHTLTAGVTIRLYRGSDGSLMDSLAQEAVMQSLNPIHGAVGAIDDACAKLRQDAALYAVLAAVAPIGYDELIVTVEEPGQRRRFDQLLNTAESAGGAGSVQEIFFTAGMARLRVKYAGHISDFVDAILAEAYDDFTLEPRHVIQRDILLRVKAG